MRYRTAGEPYSEPDIGCTDFSETNASMCLTNNEGTEAGHHQKKTIARYC